MQRLLCECGHSKEGHNVNGNPCLSCDCEGFRLLEEPKRKKPTLAGKIKGIKKRLCRKFDMNQKVQHGENVSASTALVIR